MSLPSQAALAHLRGVKPNDGWSVKKSGNSFRLLRRNVPLSDNEFLDIHYCHQKKVVVGVLTEDGSSCQVLVDERGLPVSGLRVISVSTYDPNKVAQSTSFAQARNSHNNNNNQQSTPRRTGNTTGGGDNESQPLSPEQNQELIKYALIFFGIIIVAKILTETSLAALYIVVLPLGYLYALQTCPPMRSFEPKKELKRVLRGNHLPENHPDKPRGFLEEMAARVAASVTTELATLPGYELEMTSLAQAGWVATVRVPTAKTTFYWVGIFGQWRFVTAREQSNDAHVD